MGDDRPFVCNAPGCGQVSFLPSCLGLQVCAQFAVSCVFVPFEVCEHQYIVINLKDFILCQKFKKRFFMKEGLYFTVKEHDKPPSLPSHLDMIAVIR